jgi:hypothetical protein
MPPFGNLFGMKVYVDFEELVQPIMLEFGVYA